MRYSFVALLLFIAMADLAAAERRAAPSQPTSRAALIVDGGDAANRENFDFPRVAENQSRPAKGIRPTACDTTCYCQKRCKWDAVDIVTCVAATHPAMSCKINLYCDQCEAGVCSC